MTPSPTAVYRRATLLIALGCVVLYLAIGFSGASRLPNLLAMGILFGTLFQHALLAGVWCVLGPGELAWRGPLSFLWAVLLGLLMMLPRAISGDDPTAFAAVVIAAALWLVVQLPLWVLALLNGLRLYYQGAPAGKRTAHRSQFGIGQLMGFTAFVAIVLGAGRLLLAYQQRPGVHFQPDWVFPAVLITAQIVTHLPLCLSCLLPRYAWLSVGLCLLVIAIVTVVEEPILVQVLGNRPPGLGLLIGIFNGCSVGWTLAFGGVVRWSGYHLGVPQLDPLPDRSAEILKPDARAKEPA